MRAVLFILFIFTYALLFSQEIFEAGYIVNNSNDTIYGELKYRGVFDNNTCLFKNGTNERVYTPLQIKAYGFINGEQYRSKSINNSHDLQEYVFLQLIIEGKTNFYVYYDQLHNKKLFIENERLGLNELVETKANLTGNNDYQIIKKYVGVLSVYLSDSTFKHQYDNVKLNIKDIKQAVTKYNSNFEIEETSYPLLKKSRKGKSVLFIIGAGFDYSFNKYYMSGYAKIKASADYQTFNTPGFSLKLSVKFPFFFNNQFSINTGLSYQGLKYQVEYHWPINQSRIINYKQDNFIIPLYFSYEILKSKLTPYVSAGGILILNQNVPNNNKMSYYQEDYFIIIGNDNFNSPLSFLLELGIKYNTHKGLGFGIGIGYTKFTLLGIESREYIKTGHVESFTYHYNWVGNKQITTSVFIQYKL